jgi:putative serine protease PepD
MIVKAAAIPMLIREFVLISLFFLTGGFILSPGAEALLEEESNNIAVFEKVSPSVVNITKAACEPEFYTCPIPSDFSSGSGIIVDIQGTIVTTYHVIANAQAIQVTLADGRRLPGELIGSSQRHDLAVIRVEMDGTPLTAITMGNSANLKGGEKVLAIGNPFGLGQSLSVGIVSMTGRNIRSGNQVLRDLIQTDASINPGNSGGALVDSKGELVGMNTVILSPTGSNVGIGFAIPVNYIKEAVPGLTNSWQRWSRWTLATILIYWLLRRIYNTAHGRLRKD